MRELIGVSEIAEMFGVSSSAVKNWRKRFHDFPQPVSISKSGPVFRAEQIEEWNKRRNNMSTVIVASINLKGGVAKTTTTVGLAQVLSGVFQKKVLVIDLDPQTNATTMLIGEEKWSELNNRGYTLKTLFADAVEGTADFNLDKTLQKSVGDVMEATTVDLLPSSLGLIELQDKLANIPQGKFGMRNPVTILLRGIKPILDDYDYILIDCPPNLGHMTLNGLRIVHGYIIPTIPDILSTYGISQILNKINNFSEELSYENGRRIIPLGIVATKVRAQAPLHERTLRQMREDEGKLKGGSNIPYPKVFETCFNESVQMAEAAEFRADSRTIRQKWGYGGQFDAFEQFAKEFMTACEGL